MDEGLYFLLLFASAIMNGILVAWLREVQASRNRWQKAMAAHECPSTSTAYADGYQAGLAEPFTNQEDASHG